MQFACCGPFILIACILAEGAYAQPPKFTSPSYSVQVQETTTKVVTGVAPSPRPPNGFLSVKCTNRFNSSVDITYTIGQVNGFFPFVLNSTTGNFLVTQDLIYASQPRSYNFSVWCYDNLSPNLSSNASVNINVIEVDKYDPTVSPSPIYVYVNETTPVGTVMVSTRTDVGALRVYIASDLDVGPQGVLSYIYKNPEPPFSLNGTSGSLTLVQYLNLDFVGATSYYNPRIDVCDPYLCTTLTVHITVTSQNEYYPMFSQKVYSVTYNDSTPPGQVINSTCTDQDRGVGALRSVVFFNTTSGVFILNSSTGALTTNITMDYRNARGYTVVLLCRDTGGLTNTTTVYVSINPPPNYKPLEFMDHFFVFNVSRAIPPFSTVGQIKANDESIWATLVYSLQNNSYFTIQDNGTLKTLSSIYDYMCDVMVLNATVTDGVYTNFTTIYIILSQNTTTEVAPPTEVASSNDTVMISTSLTTGTSTVVTTSPTTSTAMVTPTLTAGIKAVMTPPSVPASCLIVPATNQATPTQAPQPSIVIPIVLTLVCGMTLVVVIILCFCLVYCHYWRLDRKQKSKESQDNNQPLGRLSSVAFVNRNHQYEDEYTDIIKPTQGNVMAVPVPLHEEHVEEIFAAPSFNSASTFEKDKAATGSIFQALSNETASELNDDDIDGDPDANKGYVIGPVLQVLLQKWDSTEKVLVGGKKDTVSLTGL